ncbi:MAG: carbohydrate kinase [Chthoniobacteraceae bacterium]
MKPRVFALGEVLWDLLPGGPVLGGAPANFAHHARALGAETTLISRVGDDELGREILRHFAVQVDPQRPTGTVSVELTDGQPRYTIHENVAWDAIEPDGRVREADVVCFGSLAQRAAISRASIQRMVAATRPDALRVFDINLRQHFYSREVIETSLALANVLKLNDAELPVIEEMFALRDIEAIAARFDLRAVALTRGSEGCVLWSDGARAEHAGVATTVRDTIGAGDSFTAALTLGLLAGRPLDRVLDHASRIAAYVCSQSGATPPLPPELLNP